MKTAVIETVRSFNNRFSFAIIYRRNNFAYIWRGEADDSADSKDMILYIVVPCYNEEEVLPSTSTQLADIINGMIRSKKISPLSRVLFVDDGSKDRTWSMIEEYSSENTCLTGIKLAGNCGHQKAIIAGMTASLPYADAIITIDADLQDDINVIEKMVDDYSNGIDIVYGVRKERKTDTFIKRNTALAFYRLMTFMGTKTVNNHADFRLMSKRATESLLAYKESNLFVRGLVTQLGYKTSCVYYDRKERTAGESKYPMKKMIEFAIDGITSMTTKPLNLIILISILFAITSILLFMVTIIGGNWGLLGVILASVWAVGAVITFCIGVVGEYVGKTYMECKNRPRFIIEKDLNSNDTEDNSRKT